MVNLDALSYSELKDAPKHLSTLADYANQKLRAMHYRLSGNISLALKYEESCEQLYATLPEEYRW